MKLNQLVNKLFKKEDEIIYAKEDSPFTSLTPIDNATSIDVYKEALSFALGEEPIKDIALTGPYGSGKSSIIQTFEKENSHYKFLNISLASFKEKGKDKADIKLIERSILQQMLYGADADKLPYSRFKRISTPEHPLIKASLFVMWMIAVFFLFHHHNELITLEPCSMVGLFWLLCIDLAISLPILLISDIYKASFGISLKKISLKNAEIEAGDPSENSILNRHLDEIIYFFQQTKYDLVVIEDLDRFGDPEIFVKLREINKLINDNGATRDQVKFLYALKDDMFAHKKRAKFFDFIIPVVPIINSSNSLEKMLPRLNGHHFSRDIDTQLLRDVSLYIDDLRLIHNIFNEFIIYYEKLKSESLDVTKLLAMMIYKNSYPNDFENLHHSKGALFEIITKRSEYLKKSKDQLKDNIDELRNSIQSADNEEARSVRELISTYVGYIISHNNTNEPVFGIICNQQLIKFSSLITFEKFSPLCKEENIQIATHPQNHPHYRITINKSFSQIEKEINPDETFLSRKESIENKIESKKIELQQKTRKIEKKITELPQLQFFKLLQRSDIDLDELIKNNDISNGNLLKHLVLKGYLDDKYHLYISNFHEGSLTKNDRDYILTIHSFNQPDPNQIIDTPQEVCTHMDDENFEDKYVLNVTLIDYLLENKMLNSKRIKSAIRYISQNFEQSEELLAAYFISGKYLEDFICYLSQEWPGITLAAISSKHTAELISYILRFVDAEYISQEMNSVHVLTDYLSDHGHLVLASGLQWPNDYTVLKNLNLRFRELALLEPNDTVLEYAHTESLYAITSQNINYILQKCTVSKTGDAMKPEKANYTSILTVGSAPLKENIENNLPEYIEKVFLSLPDNSEESETAIKTLFNHQIIENELRKKIISKQDYVFKTFEGVPEHLWSYILLEEKIIMTWQNISEYFNKKDSDRAVVTDLLQQQHIVDTLSSQDISTKELGEENSQSMSDFILNNDEIADLDYCKLITCLPYHYDNYPEKISNKKLKYLAKENIVTLNEDSFNFVSVNYQLTAMLVSKNFDVYLKEKDNYPIHNNVIELLLSSEISDKNKIILVQDISSLNEEESELSCLVANLLISNEIDCSNFEDSVLSSAIVNAPSSEKSIQLFIKCLSIWDEEKTMLVLAALPEPFSEISTYGKRPKLNINKINLEFSKLLESKGFISSANEKFGSIKIYTFKSNDHSE